MLSGGSSFDIGEMRAATPQRPAERSVMDIERAALDIGRQNSALRLQADAYGPGVRNADGSGGVTTIGSQRQADIEKARYERDTGNFLAGSSLKRNATEGRARIAGADKTLAELGQQGAQDAGERNSERSAAVQAQQIEATQRGQDIAAQTAARTQSGNNRTQLDIAQLQGQTQKDVASLGADSRLAAAEARAATPKYTAINLPDRLAPDGITVMKGGQVLVGSDGKRVEVGGDDRSAANQASPPRVGEVRNGFRFKGGDPSKPYSWTRV